MADETARKLSETDLYALLTKRRRRLALRILQDFSTPLTAIELARYVAECEYEDPSDEILRIVHISFYHNHLPKLDDADVVTYDRDDGTVRQGPQFAALIAQLEEAGERTDSRIDL